ncbi:MAG: primosomal protein N' [Caulobacter sp.]|nr:primosomal protein N' [Caulobacter sp.]
MSRIASVLLPMPLPEAFDYAEPEGMDLAVGDQVAAPLGPRLMRGVVTQVRDGTGGNRPLKPIAHRIDDPPLPAGTVAFIEWAARYAADNPGWPLAMALRGLRAPKPKPERVVVPTGIDPKRPTPARTKVLDAAAREALPGPRLAEAAGVSSGVVKGLIDEGCLVIEERLPDRTLPPLDLSPRAGDLNPGQAAAAAELIKKLDTGAFSATLLDGVTGSGKTEVYLEAAAHALSQDPEAQVLILLPEIALTQAVIARVAQRFGSPPGEWHSAVPPPRRRTLWEDVAAGRQRIVVGARSALFLPFRKLSLIVVDEEHDGSYKQEDGFIYQGRDLAVARAHLEGCAVVLASATPSLETLWNAEQGRYGWLKLTARHGTATLPEVTMIDLRETPPERDHWLSPPLVQAMIETLERGEQTLLFLNRRGYAPVVLCRACGERLTAPDTDSWLVEHRYTGRLVCHLTGFSMPKPETCPHCGAKDSLVSIGPGVERVEEEAKRLFPEARTAIFSSDTMFSSQSARELVESMERGEIDILVATQAAAKGHNFPNLTLVGVVDADLGLRGGDLRAGERTFQLLAQAGGRAGRADRPGRVLMQTYAPEHPVMQALAANDRDSFVAAEMELRQLSGLPPFGRLAAVILSGPDPVQLEAFAQEMARLAPNAPGVEIFGPADAPLGLIRGRRRKRLLVRADRSVDLSAYMAAWKARVKPRGALRLTVDIDPYSFL